MNSDPCYTVRIADRDAMQAISPIRFPDIDHPVAVMDCSPNLFGCIAWRSGVIRTFPVGFMLYYRTDWGIALVAIGVANNSRRKKIGSGLIDWAKNMLDAGDVIRTTIPTTATQLERFVRANGLKAIRRFYPLGRESFEYQFPPPESTQQLAEKRGAVRA